MAKPEKKTNEAPLRNKAFKPLRITSLGGLSETLLAVKTLVIDLNDEGTDLGRPYPVMEFQMRPLSDAEWAQASQIYSKTALTPPEIPTKPGDPQRYNDRDPAYLERVEKAVNLQRVFALTLALVGFDFGSEPDGRKSTLEEKAARFRAAVQPKVFDALYAAVRSVSADPVRTANFI